MNNFQPPLTELFAKLLSSGNDRCPNVLLTLRRPSVKTFNTQLYGVANENCLFKTYATTDGMAQCQLRIHRTRRYRDSILLGFYANSMGLGSRKVFFSLWKSVIKEEHIRCQSCTSNLRIGTIIITVKTKINPSKQTTIFYDRR